MDSLTRARGAVIHGVEFIPLHATRTTPPSLSNLHFFSNSQVRVRAGISSSFNPDVEKNSVIRKIKSTTGALILTAAAAALMIGKFSVFPARAENQVVLVEEVEQKEHDEQGENQEQEKNNESPLSESLESHSESLDDLKSLFEQKIEDGEEKEALEILKRVVSAEPLEIKWKLFMAGLLNNMGERFEVKKVLEEILAINPLHFEALLHKSLIMEQCGEGQVALQLLDETLKLAQEEQKEEEARNVRLIIAQIQFLQKNIDEALTIYQELAEEDPTDYRPFFCQGAIYCLLDQIEEADEQFDKCQEISPMKFEAEGFSYNPLEKSKYFKTELDN